MPSEDVMATVGRPLTTPQQRDAIHIALLPATIASKYAYPGEPVKLAFGSKDHVLTVPSEDINDPQCIGIIDPYISGDDRFLVQGARVWVFLKPGTVTGLRHHYHHPIIDQPEGLIPPHPSEVWLHQFAERWGLNYEEMLAVGTNPPERGNWGVEAWITARGVNLHSRGELGADYDLFWQHLSALTGKDFDDAHKDKVGWSCSC